MPCPPSGTALGVRASGTASSSRGRRPGGVDQVVREPAVSRRRRRGWPRQARRRRWPASVGQVLGAPSRGGQLGPDPQLRPRLAGRARCLAAAQDSTFQVGHGAVLLGPLGDWEDDIGKAKPSRTAPHRQRRADRERADAPVTARHSGAETTTLEPWTSSARGPPLVPNRRNNSTAGTPFARGSPRGRRPRRRRRRRVRPVLDAAIPRQLVGLLAVLAATLPMPCPVSAP